MGGLINRLLDQMRDVYLDSFQDHSGMRHLVNEVIDAETDFEQLLTFLADTPSVQYQAFAAQLREVFSSVLRTALDDVRQKLGDKHSALYAVLLDMHQVRESGEVLNGFITLNYDSFLEHAIEEVHKNHVNYGVQVHDAHNEGQSIPVLKLHGSFDWRHEWPIQVTADAEATLWIPPGIRKVKEDYPFTAIWGAARELLDCDILRIIGCNLGPNDWDLVSLLFTTMHGRESALPYKVEVVGKPKTAHRIARDFPYLSAKSLLEFPEVGRELIAEVSGGEPTDFLTLDEADQKRAFEDANAKIKNPFEHWLRLKGELMLSKLRTIKTDSNIFQKFVEEPV